MCIRSLYIHQRRSKCPISGYWWSAITLGLLTLLLIPSAGCVSAAANMLYAIRGNDIPAEYKGLTEKRVAVVCTTNGAVASDAANTLIASFICSQLQDNLPKAKVIPQAEVERWIEIESWSGNDPLAVGRGVKAEQLIFVKVNDLKLRDGATLFRGQCNVEVSVYDLQADGKLVFNKQLGNHSFPQHGGVPITDTTEANFRSTYLQHVARRAAVLFHPVDATWEYALDATSVNL
ncbi:MAG: hypothetical protein KF752_13795 [Pirellulaceae bacterium]|nr:hypothetical protein [Pirellulaceae bacterium]